MSARRPPRWAQLLAGAAMPAEYREEHLGDLEEGYRRRVELNGPPAAARWYVGQALRTLPHALAIRTRTMRSRNDGMGTMMETLVQDVRYGLRSLRKSPTFATAATLTLALAIGVNTAIFSIVGVVVFADLPMTDAESVAVVRAVNPRLEIDQGSLTVSDYLTLVERSRSFAQLTAITEDQWVLTGGDEPLRVTGFRATANTLDAWRRPPVLGRGFAEGEDLPGAPPVAIVSYPFWQSRFAGDPAVLGSTLRLDDTEHTIVGVMDPRMGFAGLGSADVWAPLVLDRADPDTQVRRLFVSGRLAPGVTQEMAADEAARIGEALARELPETHAGWGFWSAPTMESLLGDEGRAIFVILILTVSFVILIACANIANMMLARATGREREMSVRAALGARRGRLVRQLLTESFVISLAAGGLGLLFARGLLDAMIAISQGTEELIVMARIDGRVLGFTLLVALVAPLAFGMLPALRASGGGAASVLRDARANTGGRSGRRARNVLVGAQVTLAFALMVVATLLSRTMVNLQTREVGFDPRGILTVALDLPETKYATAETRRVFYEQTLAALARVPSVSAVALTHVLPAASFGAARGIEIEGRPLPADRARPPVEVVTASPSFFDLTGIPLLQGRIFGPGDDADAPGVALVSQEVASLHWPDASPIGRRIRLGGDDQPWLEVVGVVGDIGSVATNQGRPARAVWRPYAQDARAAMFAVLRAPGDVRTLVGPARAAVWSVDPNQPIDEVATLRYAQYRSNASGFALVSLFATFALFALVMAAIGIYGVMSYSVSQRRPEIGLRMALGAEASSVRGMIVRQGLAVVTVGIVLGIPLALALARMLQATLFAVSPTDPLTFGGVPLVLAVTALVASWVPALRATRSDPMRELRAE